MTSRRAGASTAAPEELGLKHHREYAKNPPPRARWRITCIFVDKRHRGRGVARAGLEGALAQIADAGGGLVEAISEVTAGREAHGRFLFSATAELFEQFGFARGRQVGKHAWIVSREIKSTRMTAEGKVRRDAAIMVDRVGRMRWDAMAAQRKISRSQAIEVYRQGLKVAALGTYNTTADVIVEEAIEMFEAIEEDMAEIVHDPRVDSDAEGRCGPS